MTMNKPDRTITALLILHQPLLLFPGHRMIKKSHCLCTDLERSLMEEVVTKGFLTNIVKKTCGS